MRFQRRSYSSLICFRYALASSMSLNASSIALSSSSPALFTGVAASSLDLLHAHTPRLAVPDVATGGSVSRTSSAGSAPSRELHPLSLAWDGGGASSAKVTSSASQGGGDNPFMLADSSDDDGLSGPGLLVRYELLCVVQLCFALCYLVLWCFDSVWRGTMRLMVVTIDLFDAGYRR